MKPPLRILMAYGLFSFISGASCSLFVVSGWFAENLGSTIFIAFIVFVASSFLAATSFLVCREWTKQAAD